MDPEDVLVAHVIMIQHSMKAGMKEFEEGGKEAVSKELSTSLQRHLRACQSQRACRSRHDG
jgi:hypothetical protein